MPALFTKYVNEKPRAPEWWQHSLTFHEVEQLLAFSRHGLTTPGDTISHTCANLLCSRGLAARMNGFFVLTDVGQKLADQLMRVATRKG